MSDATNHTPLLLFEAFAPFRFRQPDAAPAAEQRGRAGARYLTSSTPFVNQVVLREPARFRVLAERAQIACRPRAEWPGAAFEGRSVLFLLPSQMLGSNVATMLFIDAFIAARRPKRVGVFCARSSSDIYLRDRRITTYPLWLPEAELPGWDAVIDLGHLESRRDIDLWPVEMEGELNQAFGLEATTARYPSEARSLAKRARPSFGILPLASSPLRTLPPPVTLALADALAPLGEVTVSLNRFQRQGQLQAEALKATLPKGVRIVDGFAAIGELLRAVERFDYGIYADSGPAHMTKLCAAPGTAVYAPAPGEVLQGRFRNLALYQVPFQGPHCATPCGLAKLRKARDGRIGCMGSLGLSLEELPDLPGVRDSGVVEQLHDRPVPCLATLAADPKPLVDFVLADLKRRGMPI
ncbi:hypothetical protein [Desertibaculum subflavum]|uniref:hypothetical protein n=1 Tax=Desertibaculum subflavum TaxID=2268458 RepID=UPI000E663D48